jgi:large subunit ribosomal protein L4
MASVTLYKIDGTQNGSLDLPDALFSVKVDPGLVHEAVVAQGANSRSVIAHTKTRGEVRGGGRKPWKQKGTGRARHGSRRSPIWSGGGITFGPRSNRNYSLKMNKKARQKALAMVLTDKLASERLVALESLSFDEVKTKVLVDVLKKLPVNGKKTLIVTTPENKSASLAAKNIPLVDTLPANALNVIDLLRFDYLLITKDAADFIGTHYNRT